ncbi:hypothetical protein [Massilia cavernae]|uniref:hypothetical protein n=1 Tax=Massilia cavernae TaxID=2320864 RepID=UPI0016021463|nr:hypothetical protein [Massilia cavernae]
MDQLVEHGLRPFRVDRDQALQVGQRIEQHVRLDLRLQQAQLGLQPLALDGFRARLFFRDGGFGADDAFAAGEEQHGRERRHHREHQHRVHRPCREPRQRGYVVSEQETAGGGARDLRHRHRQRNDRHEQRPLWASVRAPQREPRAVDQQQRGHSDAHGIDHVLEKLVRHFRDRGDHHRAQEVENDGIAGVPRQLAEREGGAYGRVGCLHDGQGAVISSHCVPRRAAPQRGRRRNRLPVERSAAGAACINNPNLASSARSNLNGTSPMPFHVGGSNVAIVRN